MGRYGERTEFDYEPTHPQPLPFREGSSNEKGRRCLSNAALRVTESGNQFRTIVTARRFCAQLASSDPKAIGRSLP